MTRKLLLCVAAMLFLASTSLAALIHTKGKTGKIDNQYIFVMHKTVTDEQRVAVAAQFEADGHRIRRHFRIGTFHGFSVQTTAGSEAYVATAANHPHVRFHEQNQYARIQQVGTCHAQKNAVWGLDRITEHELNLDGRYVYDTSGTGVDAYIVDTGIWTTHQEFNGGRALWGATFTDDGYNQDCNGHGTHVAGTVGGSTYGVAKAVTLIAVKVLDCEGSGAYDGVIGGIEWVANRAASRRRPSVANMSLGGPVSSAIDQAVEAAIASGVTFAVAAGNENQDACKSSPADVATAVTVGATEIDDNGIQQQDGRAAYSNWGKCIDLFAPGSMITSSWIGSNTAIKTISGTSMATPHVAGVIARYLTLEPSATPAQVNTWLISNSNLNQITMDCTSSATTCKNSPNRLLYIGCQ